MTLSGSIPLSQRYQLAREAGFSPADAVVMAAISMAECANCDMSAVNATGDTGLWQINQIHWPLVGGQAALSDPLANARAAYKVWSGAGGGLAGFKQWCTYPGGCGGQPGVANFGTLLMQATAAAQGVDSAAPQQVDPSGSGAVSYPPGVTNPAPSGQDPSGLNTVATGDTSASSSSSGQSFTLVPGFGPWPGIHVSFGFLWAALFLLGGIGAIIAGLLVYFHKQVGQVAGKAATVAAAA